MNIEKKERKINIDKLGRAYGTGKRKTAIARVWIKPGSGVFKLNKDILKKECFENYIDLRALLKPFIVTDKQGAFDVISTVSGGGKNSQLEAVMYGIAKALVNFNTMTYDRLREAGLLTRDNRIVQSKHYGQHKARRKFQFSKR